MTLLGSCSSWRKRIRPGATHGIETTPDRKPTASWSTFIKAHWEVLGAIDFKTVEVWTTRGLVTCYLLFAMDLKTRKVPFADCAASPDESYMKRMALDLTNGEEGFLLGKTHAVMDRDTKFGESFRKLLQGSGIEPVRLPPRSPNLNAHLERFFGSLKRECLDRMIFFVQAPLRNAVTEHLAHYHAERNHRGLENQIIAPEDDVGAVAGKIECRERLGGFLRCYRRAA